MQWKMIIMTIKESMSGKETYIKFEQIRIQRKRNLMILKLKTLTRLEQLILEKLKKIRKK
jgi:hypothetical protein